VLLEEKRRRSAASLPSPSDYYLHLHSGLGLHFCLLRGGCPHLPHHLPAWLLSGVACFPGCRPCMSAMLPAALPSPSFPGLPLSASLPALLARAKSWRGRCLRAPHRGIWATL
jgi:hypothetical protein